MRRPNRVELYDAACRKIGVKSTSILGYFSRKELVELNLYLDKVSKTLDSIARLKTHPAVSQIINGRDGESCRDQKRD